MDTVTSKQSEIKNSDKQQQEAKTKNTSKSTSSKSGTKKKKKKKKYDPKKYKRWYERNKEKKKKAVLDHYYELKAQKEEFNRQHPDRVQHQEELKKMRLKNKFLQMLALKDPEAAYMELYWRIILAPNATHPIIASNREPWSIDYDELLDQLEKIRLNKIKFTKERRKQLLRAWELNLPVKQYAEAIREIDAKKEEEMRREQSLRDFLVANVSAEELKERQEIQKRLEELNKTIPRYKPDEEDHNSHEYVIKEIKKDMAKISFDKGKTFLDILDDREHNIILSKVTKMKVWQNVVDSFDTETMLATLEKMSVNERKLCTQGNKAENRMLYLGKYLHEAEMDLIVGVN